MGYACVLITVISTVSLMIPLTIKRVYEIL